MFVPTTVCHRRSPAELPLSSKSFYLLPHPQRYRVYGLQNFLPSLSRGGRGGGNSWSVVPSVGCRRCRFARWQPFTAWRNRSGEDLDDFALTLQVREEEKKNPKTMFSPAFSRTSTAPPPPTKHTLHSHSHTHIHTHSRLVFDCPSSGFEVFHPCHADFF